MSIIRDYYEIEKLPNQSLAVIQCGITTCSPGHSSGSRFYKHYSAHFILEGKGIYFVNGKSYELGPGQGFMITPGRANVYIADKKEPWRYMYATFFGADDDTLVHHAGLDEENVTFSFPMDKEMLQDLSSMYNASQSYDAKGYDVTGWFLLVMSRLIRLNKRNCMDSDTPENYIKQALYYIENNYPYPISVNDIASNIGIDRTYLYRVFRRCIKKSPSEYLRDYRLAKAVELMENKNISISEIGVSVGFHDISHFYKSFSAKYGMSPKKYRYQSKGEN